MEIYYPDFTIEELQNLKEMSDDDAIKLRKERDKKYFQNPNGTLRAWGDHESNLILLLLKHLNQNPRGLHPLHAFFKCMIDEHYAINYNHISQTFRNFVLTEYTQIYVEKLIQIQDQFRIFMSFTDEEKKTAAYRAYVEKLNYFLKLQKTRQKISYLEVCYDECSRLNNITSDTAQNCLHKIKQDLKIAREYVNFQLQDFEQSNKKWLLERRKTAGFHHLNTDMVGE